MAALFWPTDTLRACYQALPHVELHRHFVGSMRPSRAVDFAQHCGMSAAFPDEAAVRRWWNVDNLDTFVERYIETISLVRTPACIEQLAADLAEDIVADGTVYAEVTFLPARFMRAHGIPFDEMADAMRKGIARGLRGAPVTIRFLMDMVREMPVEVGLALLEAGRPYLGDLIVGIDLGGREHRVSPRQFLDVFRAAREFGYRCVAHAGETAGPESIRAAVEDLEIERIQHGVRCLEDPSLVSLLRERQVPLAICPTSNVRLGVYPTYEAIPLRRLLDERLCVSLHTDDPGMFDTNLEREFMRMAHAAALSPEDIRQLHRNAQAGRLVQTEGVGRLQH